MTRACVWVLASVWAAGCTSLPSVDSEICGNKVLEAGEDCDGFAPDGSSCGAAATVNACFFTCDSEAESPGCPDGYGCGADGRCRQPSGAFEEGPTFPFSAERFQVADLDGDRVPDLVGVTGNQLQVVFGDGAGGAALTRSNPFAAVNGSVSIADIDGDDRDDLLIPTLGGLATFPGNAGRLVRPTTYLSFDDIGAPAIFGDVRFGLGGLFVDALFIVQRQTAFGCAGPQAGVVNLVTAECGEFATIFGAPFVQGIHPDPLTAGHILFDAMHFPLPVGDVRGVGLEVGVAINGTDRVFAMNGVLPNRAAVEFLLPANHVVFGPLFFAQLNGSGNEDMALIVNGPQGCRIATRVGAGGFQLSDPLPFCQRLLAVDDLTGDGNAEFVLETEVRLGTLGGGPGNAIELDGFWVDARIADVNGDSRNDLVAVPQGGTGVEVYLQSEDLFRYTRFLVGTQRFVADRPGLMEVADFDGDFIDDVGLVAFDVSGQEAVAVLFGSPGGGFDEPVLMGTFSDMKQLTATRDAFGFGDAALDLLVSTEKSDTPAIALLRGDSSRQMLAPRILQESFVDGDLDYLPLDAIFARNDSGETSVLAPSLSVGNPDEVIGLDCETTPTLDCPAIFAVGIDTTTGALRTDVEDIVKLPTDTELECQRFSAANVNSEPGDELVILTVKGFCPDEEPALQFVDLSNVGAGLQEIPWPASLPEGATDAQSVDLDGDGDRELILFSIVPTGGAGGSFGDLPLTILWNDSNVFSRVESIDSEMLIINSVSAARFDADDRLELVVSGIRNSDSGPEPAVLLATYDADADGYSFSEFPGQPDAIAAAVVDFNVDGIEDVVVANSFSASVFLGTPLVAGDSPQEESDEGEEEGQ